MFHRLAGEALIVTVRVFRLPLPSIYLPVHLVEYSLGAAVDQSDVDEKESVVADLSCAPLHSSANWLASVTCCSCLSESVGTYTFTLVGTVVVVGLP